MQTIRGRTAAVRPLPLSGGASDPETSLGRLGGRGHVVGDRKG
jgi:hypothetical protein